MPLVHFAYLLQCCVISNTFLSRRSFGTSGRWIICFRFAFFAVEFFLALLFCLIKEIKQNYMYDQVMAHLSRENYYLLPIYPFLSQSLQPVVRPPAHLSTLSSLCLFLSPLFSLFHLSSLPCLLCYLPSSLPSFLSHNLVKEQTAYRSICQATWKWLIVQQRISELRLCEIPFNFAHLHNVIWLSSINVMFPSFLTHLFFCKCMTNIAIHTNEIMFPRDCLD